MPHETKELPVGNLEVKMLEHQFLLRNLIGGDAMVLHSLDEVLVVGEAKVPKGQTAHASPPFHVICAQNLKSVPKRQPPRQRKPPLSVSPAF